MTIRSTLSERLRKLDFTNPVKVFLRDLIDGVPTSEEVVSTANDYITAEDVAASGYVVSGANATLGVVTVENLILSNTSWDDLRFPAQGINPAGSAAPPSVNTTDGTLEFSASAENVIAGIAQMPHSWKIGTDIEAHIHWSPATSATGNVYWRLQHDIAAIGGTFDGFTTVNSLDAADAVANKHQIHELGIISASGIDTVSSIIKWKLSRIGEDATDTYGGIAKLLEVDFHYQIDGFGSEEEYVKSY
jgi:hypothetical protein